jgi:protein-tyrosine phosphatase
VTGEAGPAAARARGADRLEPGAAAGLRIRGLPNLRDVGGARTFDGRRVRRRFLYRSEDLSHLGPDDLETLAGLGLRTVFDLRTAAERTSRPDQLPPGADSVVADVLRDSRRLTPDRMGDLLADPARAEAVFGGGRAGSFFPETYRELVQLPSARAGFGLLFAELLGAGRRPALVHCTTGKDRTGWAVAVLLLLLGVPDEAVMADYLLSGPNVLPTFAPFFEAYAARGGDPEILRPLVEVRPAYLEAGLEEVRRTYGGIEAYVADGLGLDDGVRSGLREVFLEPG